MLVSLLILAAALGCGLMSGLLFAFSNFVMQGLTRVQDDAGASAMQAINTTILNPLFFTIFFGTGAVSAALLVFSVPHLPAASAIFSVIGSLLYLVGVLGVTMLCNVPMNKQLATVNVADVESLAYWRVFVPRWMRWNHVRTVAAVFALAAFILAFP